MTIHTGLAGEKTKIHFDWFDHNNIRHETVVEVNVPWRDRPRGLEILVNGAKVSEVNAE